MDVIHEPEGSAAPWRASGAVEIRSSAEGAPHLLGSGHRVTGTLVLTAGHVVHRGGAGARHRVRFLDGRAEADRDAELVWHSAGGCPLHDGPCPDADQDRGRGLDLALLRLPRAEQPAPTARWGRFVTGEPQRVTVTGAPGGRQRDGLRGHLGLPGTVDPRAGRRREPYAPAASYETYEPDERYELSPDGEAGGEGGGEPGGEGSAAHQQIWHGVSGAAVLCDGLLIGVVQRRVREDGTLYVVPAARLLQHRCLVRLLAEDAATAPVAEPVELRPYLTAPAPPPRTPAALLDPEAAVVPLVGDAPDAVLTWCLTTHPGASRGRRADVRVRLVTAPSGWGKTRTAIEAVRRLARIGPTRPPGTGPEPMTWAAGLLTAEPVRRPDWHRLLGALTRPLLLVVDRAETRADQLTPLLAALAGYDREVPVRVLLLARAGGPWLNRLPEPWAERLAKDARPGGPVPAMVAADDHYRAALAALAPASPPWTARPPPRTRSPTRPNTPPPPDSAGPRTSSASATSNSPPWPTCSPSAATAAAPTPASSCSNANTNMCCARPGPAA